LQECLESIEQHLHIQIFGTDIDAAAIEIARRGIYPAGICADVSNERLNRFFDQRDGFFKIKKSIRDMVVFAPQNMIKDPPFTKLDMISCRNVLIYFTAELQNKIIPLFHYSLKDNGILFLGSSETTGQSNKFFTITDKKWKLFSRNTFHDVDLRKMTKHPPLIEPTIRPPSIMPNLIQKAEELSIMQLVEAILRQSNTPPCVIIDANKDILYIHGKLGKYIEPSQGKISINIIDMVRSGLKSELIATIRTVIKTNKKRQVQNCSFQHEGYPALVDLTVTPIGESSPMANLLMVVFEELAVSESEPTEALPASTKDMDLLQRELNTIKENLQTTIEELETANEELKSANEELQSTNEELQSTNEELETSKEELQSLNEESSTVNAELQCRIDDYQIINDDMKNLFESTQVATIFLDTHLCIRRFTPKAKQIINLVFTDIGRPVSHFTSSLPNTDLSKLADHVLKTLEKHESEIYDAQGQCFLVRIIPYRTLNNVIDGVVVTFENITDRKTIETALIASERRYKHLFDYCPLPMWVENLTPVAQALVALRAEGIIDLSDYLNQHPEELKKLITLIHIVQVNELTLSLFNSHNKSELAVVLPSLLNRFSNDGFVSKLLAIWNQQNKLQIHYLCQDNQGKPLGFIVDWTVPDDSDKVDYDNVIAIVSSLVTHFWLLHGVQALIAGERNACTPVMSVTAHNILSFSCILIV
jgi:two-component system CheB/CheR fusion protein